MVKSIYLNLEDDISKITTRLKREASDEVVLVVPKKSLLFSDSINLRLLKKQADMIGKTLYIMTMDEMGQSYAKEAGFELKFLSKNNGPKSSADIRMSPRAAATAVKRAPTKVRTAAPTRTTTTRKRTTERTSPLEAPKRTVQRVAAMIPAASVAIKDTVFPPMPVKSRNHNLFKPEIAQELEPARRTNNMQRFLIGFIGLAVIVGLLLVFVILPSADITVYAKTQPVSRDVDVSVTSAVSGPDQSRLSLPSTRVQKEVVVEKKFDTEGKRDVGTKSAGSVKVYNFSGAPLNLRSATTTLTLGTKTYKFKTDQSNVRTSPSTTSTPNVAQVEASEGGESFNVPAGTRLEITNQVFGNKPQALYAVVESAIVGGSSRFITTITEEDLKRAQSELSAQAVQEVRDELKASNITLPDQAFTATASEFVPSAQAGTEAQSFTAIQKVAISGLGFSSLDLATMLRSRILNTLGASVNLQEPSKDVVSYIIKDLDVATGVMRLTVHYESQAIGQVDVTNITSSIVGKSKEQASEILLANEQIERVDIALSPSWQSSIPRFKQKIDLKLQ